MTRTPRDWAIYDALAPKAGERLTPWERSMNENNGDPAPGLTPGVDCFSCAFFRWSSEACSVLSSSRSMQALLDVVEYRGTGDYGDGACHRFSQADDVELDRRHRLCLDAIAAETTTRGRAR